MYSSLRLNMLYFSAPEPQFVVAPNPRRLWNHPISHWLHQSTQSHRIKSHLKVNGLHFLEAIRLLSRGLNRTLSDYIVKNRRHWGVFLVFSGFYFLGSIKAVDSPGDLMKAAFAGATASLFCDLPLHFIDTVNTRIRLNKKVMSSLEMSRYIIQKEGFLSMTRGISATLYSSIFSNFAYFVCYKYLKDVFTSKTYSQQENFIRLLACSFVAQISQLLIYYPYDLIRTQVQSMEAQYNYKSLPQAFSKIYKANGIMGFTQGLKAFMTMECVAVPIQFAVYECCMMHLKEKDDSKPIKHVFISSIISGALAGILTNPMETITTQAQTDPEMAKKTWSRVKGELRKGQFDILYRGIGARAVYSALSTFIMFLAIEEMGKVFNVDITGIQ